MPTARPFAYNPGAPISGTTQYGTLAVGVSPELNYPSGAGGVRWWNGPDEELGWCIGTSVPTGDQPTPEGNNGTVGFWRTDAFDDTEFINLASTITGQNFTGGTQAKTYLNNNGYWTSYEEYPASLLLYLDSGNSSSYSGSGSVWYDLTPNNNDATLINSPTYSSSLGGILQFDDTSLEYGTAPDLGDLPQWTVEVWFKLTSPLTGKVTSIFSNEFDLVNKLNFSIGTNNQPTNANLAVGFFNGSWRSTTGFVPQTNVWYQVVGTYDGSVVRQYVNGTASGGTLNYVGTPQSGGVNRIMRRWDSALTAGNLVDGDLAIVKIYNTAISSSDVLESYNTNYTRFIEPSPTPSQTPTQTPTQTSSNTPTPTPSITPTFTPSSTLTPTVTSSVTPTVTPTPSQTEPFFILIQSGDILTAQDGSGIEYQH